MRDLCLAALGGCSVLVCLTSFAFLVAGAVLTAHYRQQKADERLSIQTLCHVTNITTRLTTCDTYSCQARFLDCDCYNGLWAVAYQTKDQFFPNVTQSIEWISNIASEQQVLITMQGQHPVGSSQYCYYQSYSPTTVSWTREASTNLQGAVIAMWVLFSVFFCLGVAYILLCFCGCICDDIFSYFKVERL
eukprot:TRINITY_DN28016_c0_g1_i1.p1 TRINITY_DN28016_c0_g1~~TRINITY_DN28016_c0_g1_i1.p1  ORF type:complete len:190 (-),score=13.92 TRINITY_DN28016_c0_g1_i1:59-628(-)